MLKENQNLVTDVQIPTMSIANDLKIFKYSSKYFGYPNALWAILLGTVVGVCHISTFGLDLNTLSLVGFLSLIYMAAIGASDYRISPLFLCLGTVLLMASIHNDDVDLPTVELLLISALLYIVVVGSIHDPALWYWAHGRQADRDLLALVAWRDWLAPRMEKSGAKKDMIGRILPPEAARYREAWWL
ncbi:hypothetical protein DL546_005799 [Coniochaeta pulveracea]|uniref:Uncharacterized protein n=1 Tax=Coniochaeta pulveracea TaxID=177199 RepID=A0A420Y6R8_9PEZI|nr:hypothetical protein DL546_005799 [Coniochaeta pulveracea]